MKHRYLFSAALLGLGMLFSQCREKPEPLTPEPGLEQVDFDKEAVLLMDTLLGDITGRWAIESVEFKIKYPPATGSVKKDTVISNFGVLVVTGINREEDPRYPKVFANLLLDGKTWPSVIPLWPGHERIYKGSGPQAFTLFDPYYGPGSHTHVWQPDEIFFRDLGLMGENYSIEVKEPGKLMVWRGLNRDIKEIRFKKI